MNSKIILKRAIKALRAQHARRVVVAVPVAARDTLEELKAEADEVICLHAPLHFRFFSNLYSEKIYQKF